SRIAINGYGRMGRLVLRAGWDSLNFVAINEIHGGTTVAAHLTEFDTVHGRWKAAEDAGDALIIEGQRLAFTEALSPVDIPWTGDDVDIVLECSGKFRTAASLQPYFDKGIRTVI